MDNTGNQQRLQNSETGISYGIHHFRNLQGQIKYAWQES